MNASNIQQEQLIPLVALRRIGSCTCRFGSKASISGRVRDAGAKSLLAKQLQGLGADGPSFLDLKTGQIKVKKAKKEKTKEEEAIADVKKLSKSCLDLIQF